MKSNNRYELHTFYCIQCGQKTFDLQRKVNHRHAKHHLKKLWCPHCKATINCVECRNDEEVYEFKEKWLAGEYQSEIIKSLEEGQKEILAWS